MLNRLNGWQRIGAVCTTLWFLYVVSLGVASFFDPQPGKPFVKTVAAVAGYCSAYETHQPAPQHKQSADEFLDSPTESKIDPSKVDLDKFQPVQPVCSKYVPGTPAKHEFMPLVVTLAAFLPPLLAWLALYVLIWTIRWIASGFRRPAT